MSLSTGGGGGSDQEASLNALLKTMASLVKQLDERRARAQTLVELFSNEVTGLRLELLQCCEEAIFIDQDCVNAKPREVLWRKGYYDSISTAKRVIHKHLKSQAATGNNGHRPTTANLEGMEKLCAFVEEGIVRLKKIIIRIEREYDLDLKYIVDFSLFSHEGQFEVSLEHESVPINKKITSIEIISFALESIHSLIVSLGDLHRYYLDFGLNKRFNASITAQLTARFYEESFKLNPKNGMPQNQLGTLWIGRHYNLDSVYHYLYSLVCGKPFELSEDNVLRIFQQSAAYLESLVMLEDYQVNMRDFVARFLLIVDIFFFDKNVPTFNDLCRFLLCDLNFMLRHTNAETGKQTLDQEILFKFTAILFFCMKKLKRVKSPKVFQLNAFLAAICDQFVEHCNGNFREFFERHADANEEFLQRYGEMFKAHSREKGDLRREKNENKNGMVEKFLLEDHLRGSRANGMSGASTADDAVSQEPLSGRSNDPIRSKSSSGEMAGDLPVNEKKKRTVVSVASVAKAPPPQGKKRVMKYRRRRRVSTYSSDSDLTSNFDSDSEKSAEDNDSDKSSDDDDDDCEESDEEEEFGEEEEDEPNDTLVNAIGSFQGDKNFEEDVDSDVLIEEETMVMVNGKDSINGALEHQMDHLSLQEKDTDKDKDETLELEEGMQRNRSRAKLGQMKYDPNLLLRFVEEEPTMRALKVLFDWLMDNKDIIWECFQSNPEFVHKMMTLLNTVNVTIFTRRIFFDRSLLRVEGIREDIRSLFEVRGKMPITEDLLLKHFGEFSRAQSGLDWELFSSWKVTPAEETLLRVVKLKNFGFFICDRKKFGYAFRNCLFEEVDSEVATKNKKQKQQQQRRRNGEGRNGNPRNGWTSGHGSESGENRRDRRTRQRKRNGENIDRNNNAEGIVVGGGRNRRRTGQGNVLDSGEGDHPRRGRVQRVQEVTTATTTNGRECREKELRKKGELMGKLWLQNEVKTLESKARGPKGMAALLTPYVVVDTKAFMQHLSIVKHFVSMKKFIVLIPAEVLAELDSLKTTQDRARECIRWLDRTISNGSPYLKTQEHREKLPIPFFVKPQRMGMRTESSSFVEIAEYCHFLSKKHEIDGQSGDVLTLLTGEDLAQKVSLDCDCAAVLRSIPIKFDRIDKFYGKLIKK